MRQTFKSSMDKFTSQTTQGITIFLVIGLYLLVLYYQSTRNPLILGTVGLVVICYVAAFLVVGRSYTVADGELVINCTLAPIHIPKNEITDVSLIPPGNLTLMRLYAFGGVFGYTGLYSSKELGNVFAYATKLNSDLVAVERNNKKIYLLSPDDASGFAYALRKLVDG